MDERRAGTVTSDEWHAYAEDITALMLVTKAIVYEHEDAEGAIQFILQPRRNVDITTLPWPKRATHEAPVH